MTFYDRFTQCYCLTWTNVIDEKLRLGYKSSWVWTVDHEPLESILRRRHAYLRVLDAVQYVITWRNNDIRSDWYRRFSKLLPLTSLLQYNICSIPCGNMAERSKAPESGSGPKGRGFESLCCHHKVFGSLFCFVSTGVIYRGASRFVCKISYTRLLPFSLLHDLPSPGPGYDPLYAFACIDNIAQLCKAPKLGGVRIPLLSYTL